MREPSIAKNYAEALVSLARADGNLARWGELIDAVADAMRADRTLYVFLESPRVAGTEKNRILAQALGGQVPPKFLKYLQSLITHRRQMLIPQIAAEYHGLVDDVENRVHATVTVARDGDETERKAIADRLSKLMGKEVVPHFSTNPAILGGLIVRVGDTVLDGSVRRRLAALKGRMLGR